MAVWCVCVWVEPVSKDKDGDSKARTSANGSVTDLSSGDALLLSSLHANVDHLTRSSVQFLLFQDQQIQRFLLHALIGQLPCAWFGLVWLGLGLGLGLVWFGLAWLGFLFCCTQFVFVWTNNIERVLDARIQNNGEYEKYFAEQVQQLLHNPAPTPTKNQV